MPISFDGQKGSFDSCVAHFKSKTNKRTSKKFTSEEAHKVCGSLQANQEKSTSILYSNNKISYKEENGEFYSEGFIATTHQDREGDILSENAITKLVRQINNQFLPQAGAASNRHDWIKQENPDLPLAGRAITAEVRRTEDGKSGAYVITHHHKFHPEFEEIKYNVQNQYYPGYSIEFETVADREIPNGRIIEDLNLVGYGFANLRNIANPHAVITNSYYKEIVGFSIPKIKESHSDEEECPECGKQMPKDKMSEHKKTHKGEKEMEQETQEKEMKEIPSKEFKQYTVSAEDYTLLEQFKETKEKEAKVKEMVSLVGDKIKEAVQAEIKDFRAKNIPGLNTNPDKVEFKELKDYKTSLAKIKEIDESMHWQQRQSKFSQIVAIQYKEAAKLANVLGSNGALSMGDPIRKPVAPEMKEGYFVDDGDERHGVFLNSLGRMEFKASRPAFIIDEGTTTICRLLM